MQLAVNKKQKDFSTTNLLNNWFLFFLSINGRKKPKITNLWLNLQELQLKLFSYKNISQTAVLLICLFLAFLKLLTIQIWLPFACRKLHCPQKFVWQGWEKKNHNRTRCSCVKMFWKDCILLLLFFSPSNLDTNNIADWYN